tara:strand:- start:539 stop:1549 length:1011 start_codon:yes stop_codon:yes gene_type:complete
MIKRSLFIIIILISVGSLLSNFKVFQVNIQQHRLLSYLSVGSIQKMDKEYLKRISTNYPTLSQTIIPLKAITGTYWLQNDSVIKGLDLLHQANKDNPYLGFPDAMIAGFYEFVGVKDSFNFYAKSAHNKLPNAPQHYVLLSKLLVNENKIDSLEIFFNDIKQRLIDDQIFYIYLTTALNNTEKFDSISLNENISFAKSRFPLNKRINLLTDYLVYGEEKVNNIIDLKQQAIDSFEQDSDNSIKLMTEIIKEMPDNLDSHEVLIEMHFKKGNFQEVINLYDYLVSNNFITFRVVTIEFIAISYVNLKDINRGCSLALELQNSNYKVSRGLASVCNIQ